MFICVCIIELHVVVKMEQILFNVCTDTHMHVRTHTATQSSIVLVYEILLL